MGLCIFNTVKKNQTVDIYGPCKNYLLITSHTTGLASPKIWTGRVCHYNHMLWNLLSNFQSMLHRYEIQGQLIYLYFFLSLFGMYLFLFLSHHQYGMNTNYPYREFSNYWLLLLPLVQCSMNILLLVYYYYYVSRWLVLELKTR